MCDEENWDEHPTLANVLVHTSGNYVYDAENGKHCVICRIERIRSGWVHCNVIIRSRTHSMHCIALEAFEGLELAPGEQVDHANHLRDVNSKANLRRCYGLFNANSRRPFRVSPVTGVQGVVYYEDRNVFIAHVRVYTPDERTVSKRKTKTYNTKVYGLESVRIGRSETPRN